MLMVYLHYGSLDHWALNQTEQQSCHSSVDLHNACVVPILIQPSWIHRVELLLPVVIISLPNAVHEMSLSITPLLMLLYLYSKLITRICQQKYILKSYCIWVYEVLYFRVYYLLLILKYYIEYIYIKKLYIYTT